MYDEVGGLFNKFSSGRSRIPQRGGVPTLEGVPTYYLAKLFQKNSWKWKNLYREGGVCP